MLEKKHELDEVAESPWVHNCSAKKRACVNIHVYGLPTPNKICKLVTKWLYDSNVDSTLGWVTICLLLLCKTGQIAYGFGLYLKYKQRVGSVPGLATYKKLVVKCPMQLIRVSQVTVSRWGTWHKHWKSHCFQSLFDDDAGWSSVCRVWQTRKRTTKRLHFRMLI